MMRMLDRLFCRLFLGGHHWKYLHYRVRNESGRFTRWYYRTCTYCRHSESVDGTPRKHWPESA